MVPSRGTITDRNGVQLAIEALRLRPNVKVLLTSG